MGPLLLSWALKPGTLAAIAFAGVSLFAGMQTLRLNHAKADQIDPVTHASWQSEERRDSRALQAATVNLSTCQANASTLNASLDRQNVAVQALQAASAQSSQRATKAAHDALIATENASKLAAQVMQPSGDHSCADAEKLIDRALQ